MAAIGNGHFVWYELLSGDPQAAIAFYGEVVGLKTEPFGDEGYRLWVGSQGPLGGLMELPPELKQAKVPPHWMGSVQVASVDATVALVKELGGQLVAGPMDMPDVGRYAGIADPQGASLGLFTPAQPMEAHDGSKDGEVCWRELLSSDGPAGFAFYSKLFGWQGLQDMDMGAEGVYRLYGLGAEAMGGMMTIPKAGPAMPSSWVYYFATSDLDAALGRATKRKATVLNGPIEVPGGGRIAQLLDPEGAMFALHQAPKG